MKRVKRTKARKRESNLIDYDPVTQEQLKEFEESASKSVRLDLIHLVKFLNSQGRLTEDLLSLQKRYGYTAEQAAGLLERREEKDNIQREIIEDIAQIVERESQVENALSRLVQKINDMQFRTRWRVELPVREMNIMSLGNLVAKVPWPLDLGPGRRVLKLGKEKWAVRRHFYDIETDKRRYYSTIITALESGEFSKVKRCKTCRTFFIARRLSERFCKPECSREHFGGHAAKQRVELSRKRERNFSKFLDQTEGRLTKEVKQLVKAIGGGDLSKGQKIIKKWSHQRKSGRFSKKRLWKEVPIEIKREFENFVPVEDDLSDI